MLYQFKILGICLLIHIAWFKRCGERPLNIVIDSTNLTTREDFDGLLNIVKNVTLNLEKVDNNTNVSIHIYPYTTNQVCRELPSRNSCVRRSINVSEPSKQVVRYTNISSLSYRKYKDQPFCLTCADFLIKEQLMKRSGDGAFGLILTTYPSLKKHISSVLHSKYKTNASYYLVLIYKSLSVSALQVRQPHTFARVFTRSKELVQIILSFICPEKFDYPKINATNQKSASSSSPASTGTVNFKVSVTSINVKPITSKFNQSTGKTFAQGGYYKSTVVSKKFNLSTTLPLVIQTSVITSTNLNYQSTQRTPTLPPIVRSDTSDSEGNITLVPVMISSAKYKLNTDDNGSSQKFHDDLKSTEVTKSKQSKSTIPFKVNVGSINVKPSNNISVNMVSDLLSRKSNMSSLSVTNIKMTLSTSTETFVRNSSRYLSSVVAVGEKTKYVWNSTNVLIIKPLQPTGMFNISQSYSSVVVPKGNTTHLGYIVPEGSTKYFGNSTSEVIILKPSGLTLSVNTSSSSVVPMDKRKYFKNSTKLLIMKPSRSTVISGNFSSSSVAPKGQKRYLENSTKVFIIKPSKSTIINSNSSCSVLPKVERKYLRNSTKALIVKPSKATVISGNYSSSSAVLDRLRSYLVNSSKLLLVKPTKEAEMFITYSSSYLSSVVPEEGAKKYTGNSTRVLVVKPSKSSGISANHSLVISRSSTTYLDNYTKVLIFTPSNTPQKHAQTSLTYSPVMAGRTSMYLESSSAEIVNNSKSTKLFDRYSSNSSVVLDIRTKYFTHSTKVFIVEITKSHGQYPSRYPSIVETILSSSISQLSTYTGLTTDVSLFFRTTVIPSFRGSTAYSVHDYNTSSYHAKASVVIMPTVKKVIADIAYFMKQNITKLHVKQKLWVNDFIMNTSTLLYEIEREEEDSFVQEKSLNFLSFVENTTTKIGKELPVGENVSVQTKDLKLHITAVDPVKYTGYIFSPVASVEENVQLSSDLFENISLVQKKVAITSMFMNTIPAMRKTEGPFHDIGKVFTISLDVYLEHPIEKMLTYTFKVPENNYSNYKCVFWNSTDWDAKGCRVVNVSGTSVICECDHMTSFSVLMQVTDFEIEAIHAFVLSIISYIGCSISIMGCVLLLLTYMMCGRLLKVSRNVIHMNLALAITISNGSFISADSVHMYKSLCLTVSVVMLYTYLASFFWMLVEGIHVYLMIVKVFKSPNMTKVYLIVGWVLPAVIVAIAGLKFHVNFTRDDFCWISTQGNVIWVFVGPVLFIVATNSIILITALSTTYKMAIAENDFLKLQQVARLTMLLMPIFGLTWIFGLLAINKQLIVFQYVFTIINSLQGVYIFVFYCLLNNEVKQEFERIRRKYQYGAGPPNSSESHSVYDQLFTRRLKSVVSVDSATNVKLIRYDSKLSRYDSVKTTSTRASSTYSDTLAKRLNKNYSIELINFNDGINASVNNDSQSISSSICPEEHDYGIKLNFDEVPLANGHFPSNDFVNGSCTYDTFKSKK